MNFFLLIKKKTNYLKIYFIAFKFKNYINFNRTQQDFKRTMSLKAEIDLLGVFNLVDLFKSNSIFNVI